MSTNLFNHRDSTERTDARASNTRQPVREFDQMFEKKESRTNYLYMCLNDDFLDSGLSHYHSSSSDDKPQCVLS